MEEKEERRINIHWFPGHMTKAKREMQEKLKMVDMVIELRDARIPGASKNPMLDELCKQKPRLIVLTKDDKAQKEKTAVWVNYLKNDNTAVITLNTLKENVALKITNAAMELMKPMIDRQIRKGIRPRAIRAMVVGVPNVGKSTLINSIAKKKVAQTGNKPGVTRALQWVKVNKNIELLDTPGVLWPKFEDQQVGLLLAVTGAIRDEILPLEDIAVYAMNYLIKEYPDSLLLRYEVTLDENPYVMFERIAEKRKFFMANKEIDFKRTIETFLREVRDDACGPITWEMPFEDGNA